MDIKKNTRNELFNRQEISFLVDSDKNPSFEEMKKLASEKLSKPEENIEVYGVKGKFGRGTFLVKAYVYDSHSDLKKSIQKSRKQRREEAKALEDAKKAEAEAKKAAEVSS
jgi:ribosomal protein S24E